MRIYGMCLTRTLAVAVAAALTLSGCVERSLLIKSSPSGAEVVVNGHPAGETPAVYPFRTYGVYELTASHPGCQRLQRAIPVRAPWYQQIPFDFFAENVWPVTVRDEHEIFLELIPVTSADDEAIDRREDEILDRLDNEE